ncbi:MAG: HAD-IA family hydrolase [Lachnospiraceae bacterium]|nr:HAD-IA family hydrolase [Ruminococcus sp.]MCM1275058.1 HAD-IA family hydrolase [Lachnospiraceae bacterium]
MYKAVIFDYDFTLGDSAEGIAASCNYALGKMGCMEKTDKEIRRTIGLSLGEVFRELTGNDDGAAAKRFTALFRERADKVMTDSAVMYADALPTLEELKRRGLKTGIVTSKFHYRIDEILRKFGAESLVGAIIGGDDVSREKPDPEGLIRALELLGTEKGEALYVGDSHVDALAARSAGVPFAAVLTGTTEDFSEFAPVIVAENLREVLEFVIKI